MKNLILSTLILVLATPKANAFSLHGTCNAFTKAYAEEVSFQVGAETEWRTVNTLELGETEYVINQISIKGDGNSLKIECSLRPNDRERVIIYYRDVEIINQYI